MRAPQLMLTEKSIAAIEPAAKLIKRSAGQGVQLWIEPHGAKRWRLEYTIRGRRRVLSLGTWPDVRLAEARRLGEDGRRMAREGKDPVEARRAEREAAKGPRHPFAAIAAEVLAKKRAEGLAGSTLENAKLYSDAVCAVVGKMGVDDIRTADVWKAIKPTSDRGRLEMAHRMRMFAGEVFRHAAATGRCDRDPTLAMQGAIARRPTEHRRAATSGQALREVMATVETCTLQMRVALKVLACTAVRPGELRLARWSEFDLTKGVWDIPASRTKQRKAHRVPLAPAVIVLLIELRDLAGGSDFVLPHYLDPSKPAGDHIFNNALKRAKAECSAHGFRASLSSIASEQGHNPDVIEAHLAHIDPNRVRRAYHRPEANYWPERVALMTWWSRVVLG